MKQKFKNWILSFFDNYELKNEVDRRDDALEYAHAKLVEETKIKSKKEMDAYIESIGGLDHFIKKVENHPIPLANELGSNRMLRPEVEISSLFHETPKKS